MKILFLNLCRPTFLFFCGESKSEKYGSREWCRRTLISRISPNLILYFPPTASASSTHHPLKRETAEQYFVRRSCALNFVFFVFWQTPTKHTHTHNTHRSDWKSASFLLWCPETMPENILTRPDRQIIMWNVSNFARRCCAGILQYRSWSVKMQRPESSDYFVHVRWDVHPTFMFIMMNMNVAHSSIHSNSFILKGGYIFFIVVKSRRRV